VTPAAISATRVAVAIIRQNTGPTNDHRGEAQCRHIEIFDVNDGPDRPVMITQNVNLEADHHDPFILDGGSRVGYHRCTTTEELLKVIN